MEKLFAYLVGLFLFFGIAQNLIAEVIVIDFASGLPDPTIARITPTGSPTPTLDVSGGILSFSASVDGQGFLLEPMTIVPECIIFEGVSLTSFSRGQGIRTDIIFGALTDGNIVSVDFIQENSVKFRFSDGSMVTEFTVDDLNLNDIDKYQLDWVEGNKVLLEVRRRNGERLNFGPVPTVFTHDPRGSTSYRLRLTQSATADPQISIDDIRLSTIHVPEPASIMLLGVAAVVLAGYRTCRRERKRSALG